MASSGLPQTPPTDHRLRELEAEIQVARGFPYWAGKPVERRRRSWIELHWLVRDDRPAAEQPTACSSTAEAVVLCPQLGDRLEEHSSAVPVCCLMRAQTAQREPGVARSLAVMEKGSFAAYSPAAPGAMERLQEPSQPTACAPEVTANGVQACFDQARFLPSR